jgi:hypothetical protein
MKENLLMRCSVCLAACVLVIAAPAFARTWNDDQGHTVEGEFVRVLKGKVVISTAGRMIQVPFGHLVEEDQDFVRAELEKHGLGSQLPAKKKSAGSSSETKPKSSDKATAEKPAGENPAKEDEAKLGPTRTWTDIQGRSVQARFIGMEGANIVLQVKGKRSSFPFNKFSIADQHYVRMEMTGRGEGDKVPAEVAQPVPAAPQFAQAQPPAMPPSMPGMGGIPRPTFPAMPRMPEHKFPSMPTPAPIQPPAYQPPAYQPPPAVAPSFPAPVQRPAMMPIQPPSMPPAFANNQVPSYEQVTVKKCSKCGAVLPNNITAGDSCPKCGVFFDYDQTNGKRSSWGTFGSAAGGIGTLVAIVVGLIARARRSS